VELVRFVFRALVIAIVLGLIAELLIPGGDRFVDYAAALLALATWVVPPGIVARHWHRWPKVSLQVVGIWIAVLAFAMSLSAMTIAVAVIDFIFASGGDWAWRSLVVVGAFWIAAPVAIYVTSKSEKPQTSPNPANRSQE
jgi:hypothetical protein